MTTFYIEQVKQLDKILESLAEALETTYLNFSESECKDKSSFDFFINGSKNYLKILDKRIEVQELIGDEELELTKNDVEMIRYFLYEFDTPQHIKDLEAKNKQKKEKEKEKKKEPLIVNV